MRRVLDRYVLTECLPTLVVILGVFTLVLMMNRLLLLSDMVVAKGVPPGEVLRLLVLAIPPLLPLLLPVSLLLAVLLAVGRLSADSEVVAMRACGLSLTQTLRPIMGLSFGVCLLTAGTSLWAHPTAVRAFRQALYDSVKNRISLATETGVFSEIARGITVYAESVNHHTGAMHNLFLHLNRKPAENVWILAPNATLTHKSGALELDLENGEMHHHDRPESGYRRLRFQRYLLRIPLPAAAGEVHVEDLPTPVLLRQLRSPTPNPDAGLELHRRLALPISCLVFGVLGTSLAVHHSRSSRNRGVVLCVSVLLAFYALFTAGKHLGEKQIIPPGLAMWTPNAVLGALAIYALVRKQGEAALPFEDSLGRFFSYIRRRFTSWGTVS